MWVFWAWFQTNYHPIGNPPATPTMKGIPAYSLLVKVARGVFQRCVEATLEWWDETYQATFLQRSDKVIVPRSFRLLDELVTWHGGKTKGRAVNYRKLLYTWICWRSFFFCFASMVNDHSISIYKDYWYYFFQLPLATLWLYFSPDFSNKLLGHASKMLISGSLNR